MYLKELFIIICCAIISANTFPNWQSDLQDTLSKIGPSIEESLKPLQNLGPQITQQVENGLKPLRVLEAKNMIKNGLNGKTIINIKNKSDEKVIIIENGKKFVCENCVISSNGTTTGDISALDNTLPENICLGSGSVNIINNNVCISGSGSISVMVINNQFTCKSNDGTSIRIMTKLEYDELCKQVGESATFTYYTYNNFVNPDETQISCKNNNPTVCQFNDKIGNGSYNGVTIINSN